MPVRGSGWYKRPYKVKVTYPDGRTQTKAFHWKGARNEDAERQQLFGYEVEVWDEPYDSVKLRGGL
jgi:hypothetical protein